MSFLVAGLVLTGLVSAGCALGEDSSAQLSPAATPGPTDTNESSDASEAPKTPSLSAQPLPPSGSEEISGTLGFAAVEGSCGFLETSAGKRYEVIYPEGWRLDRMTSRLLGPGDQSAGPGSVVTVRGTVVGDIASICQVGTMFRAIEVVHLQQ